MSINKLGRYDLIRVLGKGAMGLVYEARDPNLDRRVAIKTIKVENLSDEAAAEYEVRFRTEARSAARLQHPNIVSVYDSDRDLDVAYLVMEFIQGDDLKHHLDKGEVYTLEQTLGIMNDLLSALDYAHRQSIVHRDIKPANLLIEASGRVKLTDFGVARIQDSGEATRTQGSMVGTLKYMSPEQVQGRPVDARADLFAAGIVLHQLLTGKRPFDGESDFAVIQQIVAHNPAAPTYFNPQLPPAIDAVVARALAKSRDQRYSSAQEFATALQEASRQATDQTIVPPSNPRGRGASSTWTATMRAGESLMNTQPGTGLNTNTGSNIGTNIGTNTSGSIVTQELELVYWKDVKDSVDIEDIEVFLAKFPSGVYADLARRRLKKLSSPVGEGSDIGLGTRTQIAPAGGVDLDKTVMMPRRAADQAAAGPQTLPAMSGGPDVLHGPNSAAFATVETAWKSLEAAGNSPVAGQAAAQGTKDKAVVAKSAAKPLEKPLEKPSTKPSSRDSTGQLTRQPNRQSTGQSSRQAAKSANGASTGASAGASNASSTRSAKPGRGGVLALAGVAVLACAGIGFKLLSGSAAPASTLATPAALTATAVVSASAPASASASASAASGTVASAAPATSAASTSALIAALSPASSPVSAPVSAPTTLVAAASSLVTATGTAALKPAAGASAAGAPALSASAAAASKAAMALALAKRVALEKDRLAKLALEKNAALAKPDPGPAAAPVAAPPVAERAPAPAAPAPAVAQSPRQACEDRVLFSFQICMKEQCAKPAFANHPICLERKAQEQRRQAAEQSRN